MKTNYHKIFWTFTVTTLLVFSIPQIVLAQEYTVIDLGVLGGCCSQAEKINNHGAVIGGIEVPAPLFVHPFLWAEKDGMIDLGDMYGFGGSTATDINNRGQVVGLESPICEDDPGCTEFMHAFLWTKQHGMQDLGTLGGDRSDARGINNRGDVVGYSNTHTGGPSHAFIWTKQHGMQDLGTLGGDGAEAWDINNRGQVVGYSSTTPGSYYPSHAFIWTKKGGMQDYGTLGGSFAVPHNINKFGHFVGISETDLGERHAFLWTEEYGMQDLGTLGGNISTAWDLNDAGQVVGESDTTADERHAFIWDSTNGIRDLNDLIPSDSGWELIWARGINKAGEIVGMGHVNGSSYNRAFLLRPIK